MSAFGRVVDYFEENEKLANTSDQQQYGTVRNSKETVFKWRLRMKWRDVERVQNGCGEDVMKCLGYKLYYTEEEFLHSEANNSDQ